MTTHSMKSRRNRKIAAIAAGILVVGVGATYTLATWNDSEWVWGGANSDPGVGTSSFNVQQDTTLVFANSGWADEESNPGGSLTFQLAPTALTPGDSIYAPVALRTDSGSDQGVVTLQAAEEASGVTATDGIGDPLWDALEAKVYTLNASSSPFTPTAKCNAEGIAGDGWAPVDGILDLNTPADATTGQQSLAANSGDVQHYCFVLTLPADADAKTLQGRTIAPAWEFAAVSN